MLASARTILRALLLILVGEAVADELLGGVVTTAAAGGLVGDMNASQALYDADADLFVATQTSIDGLDDVVDAIAAIEVGDITLTSDEAYNALQAASPEV